MRDILPPDSARWRTLHNIFADVVEAAGYGEIKTPLIEDLGVFVRIGDATDVVTKEMYDFHDKGDRHVSLRPELTASPEASRARLEALSRSTRPIVLVARMAAMLLLMRMAIIEPPCSA